MNEILILGAGISGLSLAYHLKRPYVIYEKESSVGGICRSETLAGCTFDYAPKIFLPGEPYADQVIAEILGDNISHFPSNDWIYHHQHYIYTRFPLQKNLFGLPDTDILKCLRGMVEMFHDHKAGRVPVPQSYREWLIHGMGKALAEYAVIPQEEKKWKMDLAEMDYQWARRRVAQPDLEAALIGATHDIPHQNRFGYPLRGGIAALMNGFAERLANIRLNSALERIDLESHTAYFVDGSKQSYRALVSTLPLPALVKMIHNAPDGVQSAAQNLQTVALKVVCMVINRPNLTDKNFIYVYSPEIIFHRLSVLSNLSPNMAPPGFSALEAEITFRGTPPDAETLYQAVRQGLIDMRLITPDDTIVAQAILDLPHAYTIPHFGWQDQVKQITDYLHPYDVYPYGRLGEWEYLNINHIIPRSRQMAEKLEALYG
jgi:UDP-galactopyranose mutase